MPPLKRMGTIRWRERQCQPRLGLPAQASGPQPKATLPEGVLPSARRARMGASSSSAGSSSSNCAKLLKKRGDGTCSCRQDARARRPAAAAEPEPRQPALPHLHQPVQARAAGLSTGFDCEHLQIG